MNITSYSILLLFQDCTTFPFLSDDIKDMIQSFLHLSFCLFSSYTFLCLSWYILLFVALKLFTHI